MLTAANTPSEITNAQKHTCNVCGSYGIWDEHWGYYLILIGSGYSGYELYFKICSDSCHEKAKKESLIQKFKRQHKK